MWEVARATSAAPTYFKPFVNSRTHQGYLDGAIFHNNPVEVANEERKLLWPEDAGMHPDVLFSIGTGHHGETAGPFASAAQGSVRRRARLRKDFDDFPKPEDRTKASKSLTIIPRLGSMLSGMRNRLDNIMSAEECWHRFRKSICSDPYAQNLQNR